MKDWTLSNTHKGMQCIKKKKKQVLNLLITIYYYILRLSDIIVWWHGYLIAEPPQQIEY